MIHESIEIDAPRDQVWLTIEDPQSMSLWNPKINHVEPLSFGARGVGYRYRVSYTMKGRRREFLGEIIEYRERESLVIRLTGGNLHDGCWILETYSLSESRRGTRLTQSIDMRESGINPLARLLIRFLRWVGTPVGQRYLENLKEIVERRV